MVRPFLFKHIFVDLFHPPKNLGVVMDFFSPILEVFRKYVSTNVFFSKKTQAPTRLEWVKTPMFPCHWMVRNWNNTCMTPTSVKT